MNIDAFVTKDRCVLVADAEIWKQEPELGRILVSIASTGL